MPRPSSTCTHEHDRFCLPASPSLKSSGSEKKPKPCAAAEPASHQTGAPVSAQSASAANMPALLQKVAKHNPQYLPK